MIPFIMLQPNCRLVGRIELRGAYDTHGSSSQANSLAKRLNALANAKQRWVYLA